MVNIIVPVFKATTTLPALLESMVNQTKKMFLVTIVQDCDDEDYTEILNKYSKAGLHITWYQLKENMGPGMARQYGIDKNQMCDYIMFADADDILQPRAVEALYTEAKKNNADVVISNIIGEQQHNPPYFMEHNIITWCHGKIYRANYLKENNISFHHDLRYNEDAYFNLVAINVTEKIYKIPEYTYIWRDNHNSLTRSGTTIEITRKSWDTYIKSQVYGIEKLVEIAGDIKTQLVAHTLVNMYKYMMIAMYCHFDTSIVSPYFAQLRKDTFIEEKVADKKFHFYVNEVLTAASRWNKQWVYFQMPFDQWLKVYLNL